MSRATVCLLQSCSFVGTLAHWSLSNCRQIPQPSSFLVEKLIYYHPHSSTGLYDHHTVIRMSYSFVVWTCVFFPFHPSCFLSFHKYLLSSFYVPGLVNKRSNTMVRETPCLGVPGPPLPHSSSTSLLWLVLCHHSWVLWQLCCLLPNLLGFGI